MNLSELKAVANAMVANGKGILAADESSPTIKKRFDSIDTESTEENRRRYREMLFTTEGIADYIGGVILFDETLRQSTSDGVPFAKYLNDLGVIPGIKVDKGAKDLAGFPGEKVTEGLDGLRERFAEYRELGARFAKWRAVINIGDGIPSDYCLSANAHALARYTGSDYGWQSQHRTLRGSDQRRTRRRIQGTPGTPRGARRHRPETEHGDFRHRSQ
jgi:fructose-bisphosphate aldolase class I